MIPPGLAQGLPWIAATFLVTANLSTVRDTWRGTAGSSPVTWGIWAALAAFALIAQVNIGGWTSAAVLIAATFVVAVAIAIGAALRYRDVEPTVPWQPVVDIGCGALAALSFVVLLFVSDKAAMVMTIVTDALAAAPTVNMAWWPQKDRPVPATPYVTVTFAAFCTLAAAPADVWQVAYPTYLVLLGMSMTAIIKLRRGRSPATMIDPLAPRNPPRGDPWLLGNATTDHHMPPWRRSPFAPRIAKMIPRDLAFLERVPRQRFLEMVEELYTAGHQDGWFSAYHHLAREESPCTCTSASSLTPMNPSPPPSPRPKPGTPGSWPTGPRARSSTSPMRSTRPVGT